MLRTHAKGYFSLERWEECGGETIWRSPLKAGYARVLTDHQNSDLQMDALSTAGWKKISVIYQENPVENASGLQNNCDGYPAQQAAVMDMQEWLRHAYILNPGLPVKLYSYPERVAHDVIVTLSMIKGDIERFPCFSRNAY
jgi:hypothetical protein